MLHRITAIKNEYPNTFWTLIVATFIDRLGGSLLFPFFALYITHKFGVKMTQVGILFAIFAVTSLLGSFIGGALTDKLGRRWMLICGLVVSALSSILMGLVNNWHVFYGLAAFVGVLSNVGGPAQQAMVADLLPESKRTQGYGMMRIVANLAITFGPAIGGFLATRSYLFLFIGDAVSSLITAGIVFAIIPETKPVSDPSKASESFGKTIANYRVILHDKVYMAFLFISLLSIIVYTQMNTTLSVYLRDVHGSPTQDYGYILSLNAAMVVLFQFWITRRLPNWAPMLIMASGTIFYAIGFGMYGFVNTFALFMVAMAIITIGEMIVSPMAQTLVAHLSPEDMRGRYMAVYGFSWMIPFAIGPYLAGLVMDNGNPDWVWYGGGILAMVSVFGYVLIHLRYHESFVPALQTAE